MKDRLEERERIELTEVRERLRNEQSVLRGASPDHLAYTFLDAIVSVYLAILDGVDDQVEDLQGRVLVSADPACLTADLRAQGRPPDHPESGRPGTRGPRLACRKGDGPYFRGVCDRCIQAAEFSRNTMSGTLDVYVSNRSNRLTEITTVPTIVASIFIPLTFIAGLYGMNIIRITFVDSLWGYLFVLLLTTGVASAMLPLL